MWSISIDDEVAIEMDKKGKVVGPMANSMHGMMMFEEQIPISPVGPFIKLPPKNENEWFTVAFHYIINMVGGKKKVTVVEPKDYEKYIRPHGPDAVY